MGIKLDESNSIEELEECLEKIRERLLSEEQEKIELEIDELEETQSFMDITQIVEIFSVIQ